MCDEKIFLKQYELSRLYRAERVARSAQMNPASTRRLNGGASISLKLFVHDIPQWVS